MAGRHNRSFSYNLSASNNNNNSVLQESEVVRLQRDVDNYTRKVELERRRYFNLHSTHAALKQELLDRSQSVADLKRQQIAKCQRKDLAAVESLKRQTIQYDNKYDQLQATIESTRDSIDLMRKSRSHALQNTRFIKERLESLETNTTELEAEIKRKEKRTYNTQYQMLLLKTKNEEEKTNYQSQFESLQQQVTKERHERDKQNRSFQERRDQYETFDTSSLLRRRLQRLILNNKEKVKIIDAYQRNMRIIDEAFNQIKEATGLTDIDEIQSNFIKSEEQNYALLTYLDILNQEIDNIEDLNQELELKCADQEVDNVERQRILQATPDGDKRKRRIQQVIDEKQTDVVRFQSELNIMQPMFQDILSALVDSKFNTNINSINTYKDGFQLNEGNLDSYLAELEDFVNQMLLFQSKKYQPSMFFTSTLLVDEIPYKDFKDKNIQVQYYVLLKQPILAQSDMNNETNKLLDHKKMKEQALEFLDSKGIQPTVTPSQGNTNAVPNKKSNVLPQLQKK